MKKLYYYNITYKFAPNQRIPNLNIQIDNDYDFLITAITGSYDYPFLMNFTDLNRAYIFANTYIRSDNFLGTNRLPHYLAVPYLIRKNGILSFDIINSANENNIEICLWGYKTDEVTTNREPYFIVYDLAVPSNDMRFFIQRTPADKSFNIKKVYAVENPEGALSVKLTLSGLGAVISNTYTKISNFIGDVLFPTPFEYVLQPNALVEINALNKTSNTAEAQIVFEGERIWNQN